MKVAVYYPKFAPSDGGGFTFETLIQSELAKRTSKHTFFPIYGRPVTSAPPPPTRAEVLRSKLGHLAERLTLNKSTKIVSSTITDSIEDEVRRLDPDLVLFPTPAFLDFGYPFIYTLWDLQHRRQPFFPEVSTSGWTWQQREDVYSLALRRAFKIIVPNQVSSDEVRLYYGIEHDRMALNPHPCPILPNAQVPQGELKLFCEKPFYIYPAQFWPHKNHSTVLEAIKLSKENGQTARTVFVGSNQGNLEHIKKMASDLEINNEIFFAGFVSAENLVWLYENSEALIYASLFGPENLPPLEAMSAGCPVICADYDGAALQLSDACLYFEKLSAKSLLQQIQSLTSSESLRTKLIEKGRQLAQLRTPAEYVSILLKEIDEFELYRRNWPAGSQNR